MVYNQAWQDSRGKTLMKTLLHSWKSGWYDRYTAENLIAHYLFFSLGFLYIVSAHFDSWRQDGTCELHDIHAKQVAKLLSSWKQKTLTCSQNGPLMQADQKWWHSFSIYRILELSLMHLNGGERSYYGAFLLMNIRGISNKSGRYWNLLTFKPLQPI